MSNVNFGTRQDRRGIINVQLRYRSITSAYYRGSVGALILYDVTNRNSFDHVGKWLEELKEHSD